MNCFRVQAFVIEDTFQLNLHCRNTLQMMTELVVLVFRLKQFTFIPLVLQAIGCTHGDLQLWSTIWNSYFFRFTCMCTTLSMHRRYQPKM